MRSLTLTVSDPVGQEVQTPACFAQNEQVQARAGISDGSGRQSSANEILPQWQRPEINMIVPHQPAHRCDARAAAAARAPRAATRLPRRREAWLRIFVVECSLPCDPLVGGHSCN